MRRLIFLAAAAALLTGTTTAGADTPGPYAGWQSRDIKALSPQQIDDLRAGRGMSLALAAELNGYPGPRHVLDLAGPLALTDDQRTALEALFREMQAEAQRLGAMILSEETALDGDFSGGQAQDSVLRQRLDRLGALQGELRYAHLRSHLTTKALLNEVQIAQYDNLRGYGAADTPASTHGSHGHQPTQP